jgi:hypothetical protein
MATEELKSAMRAHGLKCVDHAADVTIEWNHVRETGTLRASDEQKNGGYAYEFHGNKPDARFNGGALNKPLFFLLTERDLKRRLKQPAFEALPT